MHLYLLIILHALVAHTQPLQEAIIPMAIAGGLALASSAYKIYKGISQKNTGNRLGMKPRPYLTTPKQIVENNNIARNRAGVFGLPGQGILEDRMDSDVSNAVQALLTSQSDQGSIVQGVAGLQYNKLKAESNLAVDAAKYQAQNLNSYMDSNREMARYEEKNWNWNQKSPYEDAMAAASAMRNAGERNIESGISDIAKLGINYFMNKGLPDTSSAGTNRALPASTASGTVDTTGAPVADVNTSASAADLFVEDAKKANFEKMYAKALRMNPAITRDQFKNIWTQSGY